MPALPHATPSPRRADPSSPGLHPPTVPIWRALLHRLPTQCLVCGTWQQGMICTACRTGWMPQVGRCPRCAAALRKDETAFCRHCDDEAPEFDRAIAAVDYVAPWSPLIARMKFKGGTALAAPLGELLAQAVAPRRGRVSLVLPVPLSRQRLSERGFNQSWLLAAHVAQRLKLPARHDLLVRMRHTSRLMAMSAEERQQEIQGAFEVPHARQALLRGRHVALVDDVLTTGATLNEATRALLEGGARGVSVWVVARTPSPEEGADADQR